jgi:BirA family biotin operon repressor/biotin-[acetyl-CoA-carboxylase] ligase
MARSFLPPPGSDNRIARAEPALGHPPIIRLESVDSTQAYGATLAARGAVDGTVVVAETQTAGRGRRGRVWRDTPGAGLLMSVILRTSLPIVQRPLLSLAAAVAVAEALRDEAGVSAQLKWPNDVHVRERKIAGILLERHGDAVLLGIGVNVAQREFAPEIIATSIAQEHGRTDRESLLTTVLDRIARWRGCLEREGFAPVRARWLQLATTPGKHVSVDGVEGIARGLDDDGALLIEREGGVARVLAGDVVEVRVDQ